MSDGAAFGVLAFAAVCAFLGWIGADIIHMIRGAIVKTENVTIITLDSRDVAKASINGGLPVPLPPNTTEVVIRTESPGLVAPSETAPIESAGGPR